MHKWIKVTGKGVMFRVYVPENELERVLANLTLRHSDKDVSVDLDYVYPGKEEVQEKCRELSNYLNACGHGVILLTDSPVEDAGKDDDEMTFHAAIAGERRFLFHGHQVLTSQLRKMTANDFINSVLQAFESSVSN